MDKCMIEPMSEEQIEKTLFDMDFYKVLEYQRVSEYLLEKYFKGRYSFIAIMHQDISEEYIERYRDTFMYTNSLAFHLTVYKRLSPEFIRRHLLELDHTSLFTYQKIDNELLDLLFM